MSDSVIKDQVKEATDIVAVVSQYVTLKKRGVNHVGLCPFHTEKTPSFSVHGDRQFFHCFGCGKGGDVFTFLMEQEGWSFFEALKYCADRAGIQLPERHADSDQEAKRRQAILDSLAMAAEVYRRALFGPQGKAALDYLHRRGFKDATLRRAGVGYAPPSFDTLMRSAQARGIGSRALVAAGLALESRQSDRPYDRFRNRITFPIINLSGKVVGFGARAIAADDQPKYLNSPETEVYHKSRILYGLAVARDAIRRAERALIVEGYMDWLTMIEYGVENVVAVSGTALTDQQAAMLSRFCRRITLLYDADSAGQRAALRGIDVAFNAGLAVDVAVLPADDDPDSFLRREGPEKFAELIRRVPGIVEYRVDRARTETGMLDFIAQEKLAREFVELAGKITDPTRRDAFISEVAGFLRVPETRLRQSLKVSHDGGRRDAAPAAAPSETLLKEESFLRILLEDRKYLEAARAAVEPGDLEHPLHRRMFQALMERSSQGMAPMTPEELGAQPDAVNLWARLLSYPVDPEACEREFSDILKRFRERRLRVRLFEIKQLIAQAERVGDREAVNRLIEERQRIREAARA